MYNPDTELLFPPRLIPQLRDLRGPAWQKLVDSVDGKSPTSPERLAFVLLMVRLHGCVTCQADSYRAMQGCTQCSLQTIRRLRGTDDELARQYAEAQREVARSLKGD
ncbi:MAG: hypothetical protein ACOYYS_07880 [Chloroflexota bacterium]